MVIHVQFNILDSSWENDILKISGLGGRSRGGMEWSGGGGGFQVRSTELLNCSSVTVALPRRQFLERSGEQFLIR